MGVAGSGKTTVARMLAERLGWVYVDADDLHPPANVEKMRAGHPLADDDRWPWLDLVVARVDEEARAGRSTVVACSALRRSYRDALRRAEPPVAFCHVAVPEQVLAERLARRSRHFMPASLLQSQLAAFDPLAADEPGGVIDGEGPREVVLTRAARLVREALADA